MAPKPVLRGTPPDLPPVSSEAKVLPLRPVSLDAEGRMANTQRLRPARGLLLGLAIGTLMWVAIGISVWQFFR
jgi:hypothetical protein